MAVFPAGEDFATRLERAIVRSGTAPKLIQAQPLRRDEGLTQRRPPTEAA
jgi:hypothetical protein